MRSKYTVNVDQSTVRELVDALAGLPDDATVRVHTRFGANTDGQRVRRVTVIVGD